MIPFIELTVDKLNECGFTGEIDEKFQEAVESVFAYLTKYGNRAKTTKAVVKVQIDVMAVPVESASQTVRDVSWMVTTKIEVVRPKDHPCPTLPACIEDDDGNPKLFVQPSGSRNESPHQLRMTTDDGRLIDFGTGEIVEKTEAVSAHG